jgi:hypothetical protein
VSMHTLRHYAECRNMPRQMRQWRRVAGDETGRSLGIFRDFTDP